MVARGIGGTDFKMKATVVKLNLHLPTAQAATSNDIAIEFHPPVDGSISLSDELELDLEVLDAEQGALNLTTGQRVRLNIKKHDVHDLRLPGGHGTSRFPSLARRLGS
jgi:hypothetical protein